MPFDILVAVILLLLSGCYTGIVANDIFRRWEVKNKEPSPEIVRNRKELISILFVVVCLAILFGGILRIDRSWGLGFIAISLVPVLLLCIELTQERYEDTTRGLNALAYFFANVVGYVLVRALDLFSGKLGNMNSVSSNWFVLTVIVTFALDVIFTICVYFLASDTDAEKSFKRALPVFERSYLLMLALIGLLLIFR